MKMRRDIFHNPTSKANMPPEHNAKTTQMNRICCNILTFAHRTAKCMQINTSQYSSGSIGVQVAFSATAYNSWALKESTNWGIKWKWVLPMHTIDSAILRNTREMCLSIGIICHFHLLLSWANSNNSWHGFMRFVYGEPCEWWNLIWMHLHGWGKLARQAKEMHLVKRVLSGLPKQFILIRIRIQFNIESTVEKRWLI